MTATDAAKGEGGRFLVRPGPLPVFPGKNKGQRFRRKGSRSDRRKKKKIVDCNTVPRRPRKKRKMSGRNKGRGKLRHRGGEGNRRFCVGGPSFGCQKKEKRPVLSEKEREPGRKKNAWGRKKGKKKARRAWGKRGKPRYNLKLRNSRLGGKGTRTVPKWTGLLREANGERERDLLTSRGEFLCVLQLGNRRS